MLTALIPQSINLLSVSIYDGRSLIAINDGKETVNTVSADNTANYKMAGN